MEIAPSRVPILLNGPDRRAAPVRRSTRRLSALSIGLTWLLLTGCVDGYPPRHPTPLTPQEMNRDERLHVLNGIGAHGAGGAKRRIEMQDSCTLRIKLLPPAPPSTRLATLKGVYLDMDFDEELEMFDIGTQPDKDVKMPRMLILKAAAWTDASFAYKILRHLQRDCLEESSQRG